MPFINFDFIIKYVIIKQMKQKHKLKILISALTIVLSITAVLFAASKSPNTNKFKADLITANNSTKSNTPNNNKNSRNNTKTNTTNKLKKSKKPPRPPTSEAPGKASTKSLKKSKSDARKKIVENLAPKLINYAGKKVPENLVNLYNGTTLANTSKNVSKALQKMILEGNITGTDVEKALRDTFATAATDTGNFAAGLAQKYSLANIAKEILKNPKDKKAIANAVQEEIKNYAEQEMNKLANQALGQIFPIFQGVQIDFTNLNEKTLKATLRSAIVNALAQSYLGPQYVMVYMAVSTLCPPCMEKMHAELRRFDKKYIQPGTEKIGDEWNRFTDRVKEESERVEKQISAEWNRFKERVSAEYNRTKEKVSAETERAKERFNAELERAKNSKVGEEIDRQINDIKDEAGRAYDKAKAELEREYKDVTAEAKRVSKRIGAEIQREINDQLTAVKKLGNSAKEELKREAKQFIEQGKKIKDKIQDELKRIGDKIGNEVQRAGCSLKKTWNKVRGKKKKKC